MNLSINTVTAVVVVVFLLLTAVVSSFDHSPPLYHHHKLDIKQESNNQDVSKDTFLAEQQQQQDRLELERRFSIDDSDLDGYYPNLRRRGSSKKESRPLWWDQYAQALGRQRLKKCGTTMVQPPTLRDGMVCQKQQQKQETKKNGSSSPTINNNKGSVDYKYVCFFGEQTCPNTGNTHPSHNCMCTNGVWNCGEWNICNTQAAYIHQLKNASNDGSKLIVPSKKKGKKRNKSSKKTKENVGEGSSKKKIEEKKTSSNMTSGDKKILSETREDEQERTTRMHTTTINNVSSTSWSSGGIDQQSSPSTEKQSGSGRKKKTAKKEEKKKSKGDGTSTSEIASTADTLLTVSSNKAGADSSYQEKAIGSTSFLETVTSVVDF